MALDLRNGPAEQSERWPNVWWPKLGRSYTVCLLAEPVWVGVHFHPGRAMRPCLRDECPPDLHARPVNTKGYCPALLAINTRDGVWCWDKVTLEIYGRCCKQLPFGRPWEGLLLHLARDSKEHSPLRIVPHQQRPSELIEPPPVPAWDVLPILCRLWGLPARDSKPKAALRVLPFEEAV